MTEGKPDIASADDASNERLDRLTRGVSERARHNPQYSRFIRRMRLVLPLVAIALLAVVFSWSSFTEDELTPVIQPDETQQTIGKNELLNPRFESTDDKNQPYTITAMRAIQGKTNEELIILEKPEADILLNNDEWVAVQSEQGAYRQDNERLLLTGDVHIFHDQGYQLSTQELNVDLGQSLAWAETDVQAQGPAGTLDAKGLQANSRTGLLVFTGPAKLTLQNGFGELDLTGGM